MARLFQFTLRRAILSTTLIVAGMAFWKMAPMTRSFDQPFAEVLRILCHLGFFGFLPAGVASLFHQTLEWFAVGLLVGLLLLAVGGIGLHA